MENLALQDNGLTVAGFEVRPFTKFPMLHVRVASANQTTTLHFYRSADAQTWTECEETVTFTTQDRHEALYDVRPGEWVKVTSDKQLSNAEILW